MSAPIRLAVVGTPRSGNTWVRHLLAQAYDVPTLSTHGLDAAGWAALPPECVIQIHWNRDPDFLAALAAHGFRVVTVARHPLDTLISILHVVVFDVESEHWLAGQHGSETPLWGAWPRSRAFLDYAASPRAAALLGITTDWWNQPGVLSVRYEDVVADPAAAVRAWGTVLGPLRCASVADVLAKTSMGEMRKLSTNNHFWKGQPGLWRELLPPAEAFEIGWHAKPILDALGYDLAPNAELTPAAADRNWLAMTGGDLGATIRKTTAGHKHQVAQAWAAVRAAESAATAARADQTAAAAAARAAIAEAEAARAAAETARAAAETARAAADADRDSTEADKNDLHTLLAECLADLSDARAQAAETEALLAVTADRLRGTHDDLADAEDLLTDTVARLAETTARLTGTEAELADRTGRLAGAEEKLVGAETRLVGTEDRLATVKSQLAGIETRLLAAETDRDTARAAVAALDAALTAARTDHAAALAATGADLGRTAAALRDADDRLVVVGREWAAATAALGGAKGEIADVRSLAAALGADLEAARGLAADLRAERDFARSDLEKIRETAARQMRDLEPFRGLEGLAVRWAWRVQRTRNRYPWPFRVLKNIAVGERAT